MTPRKALGYLLLSAPAIAGFVAIVLASGWLVAFKIASATLAALAFLAACIVGGSKLVDEGKPE